MRLHRQASDSTKLRIISRRDASSAERSSIACSIAARQWRERQIVVLFDTAGYKTLSRSILSEEGLLEEVTAG